MPPCYIDLLLLIFVCVLYSSSKKRRARSARQVTSLSVDDNVIVEEQVSTAGPPTDRAMPPFTGPGRRPLDLKLAASQAGSSDAMASKPTTILSVCTLFLCLYYLPSSVVDLLYHI